MITFDEDHIFTWGRMLKYFRWSKTYEYYLRRQDYDYNEGWGCRLPILARSMLLSDDRLFILGPEELERQEQASRRITTEAMQKTMQEQLAAINGHRGSKLLVVDATNGKILSGAEMESVPVFDGLAGAYGRMYVAMVDGTLRCLGATGESLTKIPEKSILAYNADSAPLSDPATPTTSKRPRKKAAGKKAGS
jgi:hypothetical protein